MHLFLHSSIAGYHVQYSWLSCTLFVRRMLTFRTKEINRFVFMNMLFLFVIN